MYLQKSEFEYPNAMIFSKDGKTIVVDSPVKVQIVCMIMRTELHFDEIVKKLGKAKSTVSVHVHDLIDSGVIAERADAADARRRVLCINAEYLGIIAPSGQNYDTKLPDFFVEGNSSSPASVFRLIFNSIRTDMINSGVNVEPVLYNAGYHAGHEISKIACNNSDDVFLGNLVNFFAKNGLGIVSLEKRNPLVIRVENCYECQDLPNINRPACSFDAGMLSSVFSTQFNENYEAIETHCYAAGDPFCRFLIQKKSNPGKYAVNWMAFREQID